MVRVSWCRNLERDDDEKEKSKGQPPLKEYPSQLSLKKQMVEQLPTFKESRGLKNRYQSEKSFQRVEWVAAQRMLGWHTTQSDGKQCLHYITCRNW